MPRTFLIFGDIDGTLDVLRVECTKCARKGRYQVHKLIAKYGRRGNMMKWKEQLNGDCLRRDAPSLHERRADADPRGVLSLVIAKTKEAQAVA
jgi:hypothetical protein